MEVRTRSPLAISARPTTPGLPTEGRRFIPGTTLRGATAGKLLREGTDPESERFRSLFLEGRVRYGNLYPVSRGSGLEEEMDHSLPLPATAVSCKWRPGFLTSDVSMQAGHGVRDTLIAHLRSDGLRVPAECLQEGCDADLEPFQGFYETGAFGFFRSASAGARLISRTAIDSGLGTATSGALHTLQAVNEQEAFSGFVDVDPSLEEELKKTLEGARLRLGSDRTRGLGDVRVGPLIRVPEPHLRLGEPVEARLAAFEDALGGVMGLAADLRERAQLNGEEWLIFPITLYSGAVVVDVYMRHQTFIDADALRRVSRCWPGESRSWPSDMRLVRAFTSTSIRAGWNSAHGLPKERELLIDRGSVFVFAAPERERDALIACLRQLEKSGVGDRRDEGFGQVIVGHPFHIEEEPV